MVNKREHYFYDQPIHEDKEQALIQKVLAKYKNEPVNEELHQKIWDDLQEEKQKGNLNIPFKVVMRRDAAGKFPPYVEVILDTRL